MLVIKLFAVWSCSFLTEDARSDLSGCAGAAAAGALSVHKRRCRGAAHRSDVTGRTVLGLFMVGRLTASRPASSYPSSSLKSEPSPVIDSNVNHARWADVFDKAPLASLGNLVLPLPEAVYDIAYRKIVFSLLENTIAARI